MVPVITVWFGAFKFAIHIPSISLILSATTSFPASIAAIVPGSESGPATSDIKRPLASDKAIISSGSITPAAHSATYSP